MGLFDLETHFAFYGAYHSNPANILIHTLFVWPIFFTSLVLFYFIPSPFSLSPQFLPIVGVPFSLNFGFLFALLYAAFYVSLDRKAGSLAALLCLFCWLGSCSLANSLGFSLAWKVWFLHPSLLLLVFAFISGGFCGFNYDRFVSFFFFFFVFFFFFFWVLSWGGTVWLI